MIVVGKAGPFVPTKSKIIETKEEESLRRIVALLT